VGNASKPTRGGQRQTTDDKIYWLTNVESMPGGGWPRMAGVKWMAEVKP
jgi:hypothetical protein